VTEVKNEYSVKVCRAEGSVYPQDKQDSGKIRKN